MDDVRTLQKTPLLRWNSVQINEGCRIKTEQINERFEIKTDTIPMNKWFYHDIIDVHGDRRKICETLKLTIASIAILFAMWIWTLFVSSLFQWRKNKLCDARFTYFTEHYQTIQSRKITQKIEENFRKTKKLIFKYSKSIKYITECYIKY